ncbi:Bestrophin, RFP-TM, chloride channel-domain-containing protein [Zychaea mexicana]|uniref:Bestrophin, RFP-TM, chloride channel-domain-containing protein n=1 Tax=Zychaea mexicana TaxID=64656 RepID=UPI0022FDE64F|nr:Bestrophin, RFP-TM, chloride channel-domain-containing protein [Zychaea mexicana]KAI9490590.1 Bestrophin, RFP-TM, chloride channel-domain-containing protein [Zychaea mexicana]
MDHDPPPHYYRERWQRQLSQYPDVLRWRGSVWPSILPLIALTGLYAYAVAYAYLSLQYTGVALSNSVVPALSVVLGLLLAFRANTSYARYYEGRQLWETLVSRTRNLARLIWTSIPERTQNDHSEKMRCMKLLLAFAVSTKHHIRNELGCDYYDLDSLLPPNWVPAAADEAFLGEPLSPSSYGEEQRQVTSLDSAAVAAALQTQAAMFSSDEDLPDVEDATGTVDMSLPLEILFRMGLYVQQAKSVGRIDGIFSNSIIGHLNQMNDCLAGLERIANTPIPVSYRIHLKQSLALYLAAVPFTLVAQLRWWMVPTVILASFTMYGIDAIGAEIENPFGYNPNDLPLNQFCDGLRKEIEFIVYHLPCETEDTLK